MGTRRESMRPLMIRRDLRSLLSREGSSVSFLRAMRFSDPKNVVLGTNKVHPLRDCRFGHTNLFHRFRSQQLILRPRLDDKNVSLFAGEVKSSPRSYRRCSKGRACPGEPFFIKLLAALGLVT